MGVINGKNQNNTLFFYSIAESNSIQKKMKKIGVIIDNEFYNDSRVVNECKILASHGFLVHVLCFDFGSNMKQNIHDNIFVHQIKIKRNLKNILYAFNNSFELYTIFWKKQIKKLINSHEIDHLHVHDLYLSKATFYAVKNSTLSFTLDLHENFPDAVQGYQWMHKSPQNLLIRPNKWKKLEKKYLSYPKQIVVLSETFRDDLIAKYPFLTKEKFKIYPNVPNVKELNSYKINADIIKKKDAFVLFYFGIISERRGIFTSIEALKLVKNKIPNIKLLLVGPVDKAEKKRFADEINKEELSSHIIHYPWGKLSDLPSYIKISDICLSPIVKNAQHESGVANKVFQYMLFERPLIVSNCKPQMKIVVEESCGLAFDSENERDLAEKIHTLFLSPEQQLNMGQNGKKAILEKYNSEIAGKQLLSLYM